MIPEAAEAVKRVQAPVSSSRRDGPKEEGRQGGGRGMSESNAFAFVCEALESGCELDRLEARGTVRIALKQAGLDARTVTPAEMQVVVDRVLPGELETRGIQQAAEICESVGRGLATLPSELAGDTPERVFKRLGG